MDLKDVVIARAQRRNHFQDQGHEEPPHACTNCVRRQFSYPWTCHDGWPMACYVGTGCLIRVECPWGGKSDRLWCKETFALHPTATEAGYPIVFYHARGDTILPGNRWRSSATMPRRYSRITLEIEAVSARRVQDVTEADALAAGIGRFIAPYPVPADWPKNSDGEYTAAYGLDYASDRSDFQCSAVEALADNWKRDNPRHPLDSNPYAWRLVVRRVAT